MKTISLIGLSDKAWRRWIAYTDNTNTVRLLGNINVLNAGLHGYIKHAAIN
jgi:hypothetical protein